MSRLILYPSIFLQVLSLILTSFTTPSFAEEAPLFNQDPHYTAVGFFDMHICNWPDRPQFFKILFSTEKFADIAVMEVFDPSGRSVTVLEKSRFMPLKRKNKPEKRVFMVDLDVPDSATTGWYTINVKTTDGKHYVARDYVPLARIKRVSGLMPLSETESVSLPVKLEWKKVAGAGFYKVYLRDEWSGKIAFQSKLISDNKVQIPAGKLEPGGYYSWVVHARDLNEHIMLGDFHMGSMSEKSFFTVAD